MSLKNLLRKMVVGYNLSSRKVSEKEHVIPVRIVGPSEPLKVPLEIEKINLFRDEPSGMPEIVVPHQIEVGEIREEGGLQPKRIIKKSFEGFEIPKFSHKRITIPEVSTEEEKEPIDLSYPLIPRKPGKGERVFASAHIHWDENSDKYVYKLIEPGLTEELKKITRKLTEMLEQKLDIDFTTLKKFEAADYLHKSVDDILAYYGFALTEHEKEVLHYYMERDFIGLGPIEPLMQDENIEDISCDGTGIPIFVFHRNPVIGSLTTNIVFEDADELDSFILRLSQLCGKSISVASPLVEGSLTDGSRLQATLATDIARRGSNFTIRKFTEEPLTPAHLMNYGTIDVQLLAYLWMVIDYGKSVLVSGGTASGKTSLLNVLSLFIRDEKKIVSIEDTPELKLPHPHWVPTVSRVAIAVEETRKIGEVDLFDLLKESVRQRPDYIILGEVRGREAYVLFQQMATGHPSLATIHAEDESKLVDRLTTPPISLPPSLLGSLDIIVFLSIGKYRGRYARRTNEILEVVGVSPISKLPVTNKVFEWNPVNDTFEICANSVVLKKISETVGITEKEIKNELERRMLVLNWMQDHNLTDYKDVYTVLSMYYAYPDRVIAAILGETQ